MDPLKGREWHREGNSFFAYVEERRRGRTSMVNEIEIIVRGTHLAAPDAERQVADAIDAALSAKEEG